MFGGREKLAYIEENYMRKFNEANLTRCVYIYVNVKL